MLIPLFLLLLANVASATVLQASGRWILNATDPELKRIKLRCVNWAGDLETKIPEGLQHQSVAFIADWVANNNFNCVRLTFSIDMALNPNQTVSEAFVNAAEPAGVHLADMTAVYDAAVAKNDWLASTTTLGVFKRVIQELERAGIMVILANKVSRASWCCAIDDGNGWWASESAPGTEPANSFNAQDWVNGLQQMATFATEHANVVGIGLRSGLRATGAQLETAQDDWYRHMEGAAAVVRAANAKLLIIVGGTDFAHDLSFIWRHRQFSDVFRDKLVYEFNHFPWSGGSKVLPYCFHRFGWLGNKVGYLLTQNKAFTGPLFLSEFGWPQKPEREVLRTEGPYVDCLGTYMSENDAEWAYWALQGSYYVRGKVINDDETFGLLNNDWSGWRNEEFPKFTGYLGPAIGSMFNMTQGP